MPNPLRAIRPKDHTQLIRVSAVKTHRHADLTVGIHDCNPLSIIFSTLVLLSIAKRGEEKRKRKSKYFTKNFTLFRVKLLFVRVFCWLSNEILHIFVCVVNVFSILFIIENSLLCILTFTFLHFIGFLQFFALLYPDFCFF